MLLKYLHSHELVYRTDILNSPHEVEINQSKIIERFLPKQLSPEEVEKIVSELINKTGASGMKDMGKIMGMASKQLSGVADGKTISNIVRNKLS